MQRIFLEGFEEYKRETLWTRSSKGWLLEKVCFIHYESASIEKHSQEIKIVLLASLCYNPFKLL